MTNNKVDIKINSNVLEINHRIPRPKQSNDTCEVTVLVAQLCPTPCDPMDNSLPGSSVHGILQARILEWVAIPFSKESS